MGGADSKDYIKFRLLCCEAFNILRQAATFRTAPPLSYLSHKPLDSSSNVYQNVAAPHRISFSICSCSW
jgi:hypothetical protein